MRRYSGSLAHDVRRYGGSSNKNKLASFGLIVAEGDELVECANQLNLILCSFFLLCHTEMPKGFTNSRFFFGWTLRDYLVFLLRQVIVLASREAKLSFGLGDLEAGDPEAEDFLDVGLDLIIGSLALSGGEIQLVQVQVDLHVLVRLEFGQ